MDLAGFPTSIPKTEAPEIRMPQTILSFDYSGQKSSAANQRSHTRPAAFEGATRVFFRLALDSQSRLGCAEFGFFRPVA